jgi:hypothetical protein
VEQGYRTGADGDKEREGDVEGAGSCDDSRQARDAPKRR